VQTKPAKSFLLLIIFLLLLSACGGGTTLPETSPTSIALPTPTNVPVSAVTQIPSSTQATTIPSSTQATAIPSKPETSVTPTKTQTVEASKSKILHTFNGNGTDKTGEFDVVSTVDVLLTYTGGPISLFLMEGSNSPRKIYNGPSSTRGKYETNIPPPGRYAIGITCDKGCEWTITIRGTGEAVSSQTAAKPTADSKGDTGTTDNKEDAGNRGTTVDKPSILVANDSAIKTEKWDVFSQSKASILLSAPDTRAITLSYDSKTRIASVSGTKASVPSGAHVMVANLELGNYVLVKADNNGAFRSELEGHPGTNILIKQDATGQIFNVEDPKATHGPNTLRTIFPPGVFLRIPIEESGSGVNFSSAGRLPKDEDAPWTIKGTLAQSQLTPGQEVLFSGQVAVRTKESNIPQDGELRIKAYLLVNANGRQVGGAKNFTTSIFTSTDLPIESKSFSKQSFSLGTAEILWRYEGDFWVSDFSATLTVPEGSSVGLYQLKADLKGVKELPRRTDQNILHRSFLQEASFGTFTVGMPSPMRLTSTLLADELSEGSRGGVVAREDKGFFDISHRAGVRHQPVIPRLDNYGQYWKYRLEPYLPMLGVAERTPPAAPSINLDFSKSTLTVTVLRPDGKTDTLGPASLTRYTMKSPRTPWHKTVAEGGGNLGEVPQLQADSTQFAYQFPVDGTYVVTLDGTIADVAGRSYSITGTYDVTVANILDIETSLLPGTPFEVGNSLPIGLRVMPGLPANITYQVKHVAPNGKATVRTFKGKANEHGWWDGNGKSFKFLEDGEYRVDVEAQHTDSGNSLWVGRLTFGSAVATPKAPMILHGRRGPNRLTQIPPPWGFSETFKTTDADHIQLPYFTGDVLWGQNSGHLKNSVAILTSLQLTDEAHPLISRIKNQADTGGSAITKDDLIKAGQLPFGTNINPGTVSKVDKVNLWGYSYASIQRPGMRVREHVLADDLGGTYWRFDDAYHMQSGNGPQGDLPGDFKFMYSAGVIRDDALGQGVYAIYGSGWVMAEDDDPLGARFMPPFQGAAGGPDGGPLFTIHGREVDMFFLPLAVRSGSVLNNGETFRMAGPIMPTLPSRIEYTVTAPSGNIRSFEGRANSIGYFYKPEDDFILDEAGLWSVKLKVIHDGMTSAGQVESPYPTGGLLTPDGLTFAFAVRAPETKELAITTDLSQMKPSQWFGNVRTGLFQAELPKGWSNTKAKVLVSIPGAVLVAEDVKANGNKLVWNMDAQKLNNLASNFDYEQGIADTIDVTFYVEGNLNGAPAQAVGTLVTHGARVPVSPTFTTTLEQLPELSSFSTDKVDQFLVDLEYVVGGHPFKGSGTKDPDNGAHVNWDNSKNQWPKGTLVTDFPAIYAVSDGYVERIDTYESVGKVNHRYGVHLVFAQKDGIPVKFHISIEPSMSPGDSSFYEPFILVKKGESVRKGQILAHMYLEPDGKFPGPHIHFSVQPSGESQQAPAIFNGKIVKKFHSKFGIFGFDYKGSPSDGDAKMPPCMGYKLATDENPFGSTSSECLN